MKIDEKPVDRKNWLIFGKRQTSGPINSLPGTEPHRGFLF
ncbi:hypothetical protein QF012_000192 [Pseudomonas laurylsulfatiphila]